MPFDSLPQETKADPFTVEAFANWLARQPSAQEYDYTRVNGCAVGLYVFASRGQSHHSRYFIGTHSISRIIRGSRPDLHQVVVRHPWTMGAALERARRLLSERRA